MTRFAALAALLLATPALAGSGAGAPLPGTTVRYREDRIVLHLAPEAAALVRARGLRAPVERLALSDVDRVARRLGVRRFLPEFRLAPASPAPGLDAFWFAELQPGADPAAAASAFEQLPGVTSAEPIALVPVTAVFPDDSLWGVAWQLYQPSRHDVGAPEAWDIERGDSSIVLGVLDTGVLMDHPDLRGQIWRNAAEADGEAGVDDDGNGYVDDVHGWDFVSLASADDALPGEDWADQDPDPNDFAGHGTAVSGVAAAHTDNRIGVAGLAWNIRIMPLRVGWSAPTNPLGLVDLSAAAQAIVYATANGASVLNASFATRSQDDLLAAIDAALRAGVTIVFSAGNNGSPAAVAGVPDLISVAAVDQNDKVTAFSNTGENVSLAAPGLSLPTTFLKHAGGDSAADRQPTYATGASGTSFSAPLVAAAAALVQSHRLRLGLPPLTPRMMKLRLMETATPIEALNPKASGYGTGRLQVHDALDERVRSFAVRAAARAVGPAVVMPATVGETRLAFAMSDGEVLILGASSRDTIGRFTLPAPPVGAMAAASVTPGVGPVLFVPLADGRIDARDVRGRERPGWPVAAPTAGAGTFAAPVLADLDGDGTIEIAWGAPNGYVYAWHSDGAPLQGFPKQVAAGRARVIVAAADLDGSPGLELIAAGGSGRVVALAADGSVLPGWPQMLPTWPADLIAVDLDGDGTPEVVGAAGTQVVAWTAGGGLRFSRTMPTFVYGLAAADMDGDGVRNVIVTMLDQIGVFSAGGPFLPGWPQSTDGLVDAPVTVGGIGGSVPQGILVSTSFGADLHRLRGYRADGKRIARWPLPGNAGGGVVLADVDGDGATEAVAGSGRDSLLWVYDAGDLTWTAPAWPEPEANAARTRCPDGAPPLGVVDDVPPSPPTGLVARRVGAMRVRIDWSQSDADGPSPGFQYDVAISDAPFAPASFDAVGTHRRLQAAGPPIESATLDDLPVGHTYYFAIRAEDAAGNLSGVSNVAGLQPAPSLASGLALHAIENPARRPVALEWLAAANVVNAGRTLRIFDVTGRLVARLDVPGGVEGIARWDGRDRAGREALPGLYFARFSAPGHDVAVRFALVR